MEILVVGHSNSLDKKAVLEHYNQYVSFFRDSLVGSKEVGIETCQANDLLVVAGDGEFSIINTINQRLLSDYQIIFFRGHFSKVLDIFLSIEVYAEQHNIKVVNSFSKPREVSKLFQAVRFQQLNLPVARTVLVNEAFWRQADQIGWVFPCVMKATHGSHGRDNYLVKNFMEVKEKVKKYPQKRFVLQRFIPNKGDYRLLIAGNHQILIKRISTTGSHLNNTSQGGQASLVKLTELPEKIIKNAYQVMASYNLTVAGVDIIFDEQVKQLFFLEINTQPQLMTGSFVEQKKILIKQFIADLLK